MSSHVLRWRFAVRTILRRGVFIWGVTCVDFPFSARPVYLSSGREDFVRVFVFIVLASHTIAVRVIFWQVNY